MEHDAAKQHAQSASRVREIGDCPFCWQHKAALKKIRESFDAEKAVASAIGTYAALTEIASDEQMEVFTTTHAWIAQKSGLSPRTVQDRLAGLAEIGLVEISTPIMKAPSTYRLLPVPQPLQNDKQPLQSVQQRTKKAPLLSLEESSEESLKNGKDRKEGLAAQASFEIPSEEELFQFAELKDLDIEASNTFYLGHEKDNWTIRGKKIKDWRKALIKFVEKYETDRGDKRFNSRRQSTSSHEDETGDGRPDGM